MALTDEQIAHLNAYKEGFRDGYVACQRQMLSPSIPVPVVDQNNVVLYWTDGSSSKARICKCGGTGPCQCKKPEAFGNNTPSFLTG